MLFQPPTEVLRLGIFTYPLFSKFVAFSSNEVSNAPLGAPPRPASTPAESLLVVMAPSASCAVPTAPDASESAAPATLATGAGSTGWRGLRVV